jgi:hypothetical protein
MGPPSFFLVPRWTKRRYAAHTCITQDSVFVPFSFTLTKLGEVRAVTKAAPGIMDNEHIVLPSEWTKFA